MEFCGTLLTLDKTMKSNSLHLPMMKVVFQQMSLNIHLIGYHSYLSKIQKMLISIHIGLTSSKLSEQFSDFVSHAFSPSLSSKFSHQMLVLRNWVGNLMKMNE
jgi:hypothetical protein